MEFHEIIFHTDEIKVSFIKTKEDVIEYVLNKIEIPNLDKKDENFINIFLEDLKAKTDFLLERLKHDDEVFFTLILDKRIEEDRIGFFLFINITKSIGDDLFLQDQPITIGKLFKDKPEPKLKVVK